MTRKISRWPIAIAALLLLAPLLIPSPGYGWSASWINQSGDFSVGDTIGGFSIIEWNNAGPTNNQWTVPWCTWFSGVGPNDQMWLESDTGSESSTSLTLLTDRVGFMMTGDYNDGFGAFYVDALYIGTFDLYNLGNKSLIVTGLDYGLHTLRVVQTGNKNPSASANHVAIYGGAGLEPEHASAVPLPGAAWLLGSGLLGLVGLRRRL